MDQTGNIFYQDEFQTQFHISWETINNVQDITTITSQPYVWGQPAKGFIKNGVLFKYGVITVERQIIRQESGGYEIIADGATQYLDYIQMNFPCGGGPSDPFQYHLNCNIVDSNEFEMGDGYHWADAEGSDEISIESVAFNSQLSTWYNDVPYQCMYWEDVWSDVTFIIPTPNTPFDTLFSDPPSPYLISVYGFGSAVEMDWLRGEVLPQLIANVPRSNKTIYYFTQSGSDEDGDGSPGAPFKSLAKANAIIAASNGNLRLRFKRNEIWRELQTLNIAKNDIVIEAYGADVMANPIFTGFTEVYDSGGWSHVSGNTWSRSEAINPIWVRAQEEQYGQSFDPLKREDTQAHCIAFEKSFAYVAGVLYLNTGGPNPNEVVYEMIPDAVSGWGVTGDRVRLEGLRVHGVGIFSPGTGYGLQVFHGAATVKEFIGIDLEFIYTGYHSFGHISTATNRCTLIRCRGGYCHNRDGNGGAGSGDTIPFVSYAGTGGQERYMIDCSVVGGTLPHYNWQAQEGQQHGSAGVLTHDDNGTTYPAIDCVIGTIYEDNPFQVAGGTYAAATVAPNDLPEEIRAWVIGERYTYPGGPKPGLGIGKKNVAHIGNIYTLDVDVSLLAGGYIFLASNAGPFEAWIIDCSLIVNIVSGTNAVLQVEAFLNNGGGLPVNFIAENCRFEFTGGDRIASMSFANNYGSRARLRNCEFTFEGGSANFSHYGTAIPDDAFSNCAYALPNDLSGYIGTYKPDDGNAVDYDVGTVIPNYAPAQTDPRYGTGIDNGLEYDQNGTARRDAFDIGPLVGVLDNTAPTAPTNLQATVIDWDQINLSWTAGTDNLRIARYLIEVSIDGGDFEDYDSTEGTTYEATGLIWDTDYVFRVRTEDTAGNRSSYSNEEAGSTPFYDWTPDEMSTGVALWIEPEQATSIFSDLAGTTAQTTDGGVIKRVVQPGDSGTSPSHPYATQNTNPPTLKIVGGKKAINPTGVSGMDLNADIVTDSTVNNFFFWSVIWGDGVVDTIIPIGGVTGAGAGLLMRSDNSSWLVADNQWQTDNDITTRPTGWYLQRWRWVSHLPFVKISGVAENAIGSGIVFGPATFSDLFSRAGPEYSVNNKYFGAMIMVKGTPTEQDHIYLEAYLKKRWGVTL